MTNSTWGVAQFKGQNDVLIQGKQLKTRHYRPKPTNNVILITLFCCAPHEFLSFDNVLPLVGCDCRMAWLEHDLAASGERNADADPDFAQKITMKKGAFSHTELVRRRQDRLPSACQHKQNCLY